MPPNVLYEKVFILGDDLVLETFCVILCLKSTILGCDLKSVRGQIPYFLFLPQFLQKRVLLGGEGRVGAGQAKPARVSCAFQLRNTSSFPCSSETQLLHLSFPPALFYSLIHVLRSPSAFLKLLGVWNPAFVDLTVPPHLYQDVVSVHDKLSSAGLGVRARCDDRAFQIVPS